MIVRMAELEIEPDCIDAYAAPLSEQIEAAVRLEPGTARFAASDDSQLASQDGPIYDRYIGPELQAGDFGAAGLAAVEGARAALTGSTGGGTGTGVSPSSGSSASGGGALGGLVLVGGDRQRPFGLADRPAGRPDSASGLAGGRRDGRR